MKTLYRVDITVMVLAESEADARSVACMNCCEEDAEAHVAESTPADWYDAYPYTTGDENDFTVGEILKMQRAK